MVKKQLIMDNALELFAENGIGATSIQQITERCGISKGAFYLSFKSKNELVFGLIDSFLSEFITNIEQAVNKHYSSSKLLYHFYYASFQGYQRHSDFAKIFLKEQFTSCDIDLLESLDKYDGFLTSIIIKLVDLQFPNVDIKMRADLVFTIKGFMKNYVELFFINQYPIDLDDLCHSLVEKTTILAEYSTIPFISTDLLSHTKIKDPTPTKEQLTKLIAQKINETNDSIITQSLELLNNDLENPQLPTAVIEGLLKNIKNDLHCKWVAYLYELYLKQAENV